MASTKPSSSTSATLGVPLAQIEPIGADAATREAVADWRYRVVMLPEADRAYVDRAKVVEYLLSRSHPDGRSKAEFFTRFGFKLEDWQVLADALKAVGISNPVTTVVQSSHGTRYTVDGPMQSPDGRTPRVRTVWIVEPGRSGPRLITAHPL